MFFGNTAQDPEERKGFFGAIREGAGNLGNKVQEARQFMGSLEPDNAKALLVAGLSLLDGQSAGKAGINAVQFKQGLTDRKDRKAQNERLAELSEANLDVSRTNARTAALNASTSRLSTLGRISGANAPKDEFERLIQKEVLSGRMTEEEASERRQERISTKASGTTRNININGKPVSPQREQDIRSRIDELDGMISDLNKIQARADEDPSLVGIQGSLRRAGQTTTGVLKDLSGILPEGVQEFFGGISQSIAQTIQNGELSDEDTHTLFNDPALSEMKVLENQLGFAVARMRQPKGRLLADTIRDAKADAKLTGLVGSEDILNRSNKVKEMLSRQRDDLQKDLNELAPPRSREKAKPLHRRYIPGVGWEDIK